jgi:hypothetical protein
LYISQVKEVRACQPTEDLSSRALIAPTSGLPPWVVYGAVKATGSSSRQAWLKQASLDLSSTTNYASGIARAAKSRRIALKPLSEPVRSTRAGRYFATPY